MTRTETKASLRNLRKRASAELDQLRDRQQRLERLVEFVDEYTGARPPRRRRSRRRPPSLIEVIRERPGVRTSMLAMVSKRANEDVAAELDALRAAGKVHREGLGWRASES